MPRVDQTGEGVDVEVVVVVVGEEDEVDGGQVLEPVGGGEGAARP